MTADQRLDQLEPLVSQTLAVADRHTAQLKQIVGIVSQLLEAGSVQSDNTQFVLHELGELKRDVNRQIQDVNREVSGVKKEVQEMREDTNQGQSMINARLGVMENSISVVGAKVTNLDTKLDRILDALNRDKG